VDVVVPTSLGPSRLVVDEASDPRAALWLGHGAGGGVNAADLAALAARLPALGITVLRYEQPWRTAGKRVAARPPVLDAAWLAAAPVVESLVPGVPLVVGGRSAGARVACRTAVAVRASGVVCLSFPLRPPGSGPEKSRLAELLLPEVPVLVLQGGRDTFGQAAQVLDEIPTAAISAAPGEGAGRSDYGNIRVVEVPGADHGMKVLASSSSKPRDVATLLVDTVADFVLRDPAVASPST
jgi:predicted alpha/beta-hydrolase family hydrolase